MFSIVRCGLIHKIVEPVGIKKICTASPGYDGIEGIVIVREIVYGDLDGETRVLIAEILCFEGTRIIFRMTRDKYLSATVGRAGIESRNGRCGKYLQLWASLNILDAHGGVTRMRNEKFVVKASEKH